MYNNEKICVGIITYNRKDSFKRLFDTVLKCDYVDHIVVVKDKDVDYEDAHPRYCNDPRFEFVQMTNSTSIAQNKNEVLKKFLKANDDHVFVVEDDINIKNIDVFKRYIDTAKHFNLEHLNFCRSFDNMVTHSFVQPFFSVYGSDGYALEIFHRLSGDFSYFTKNAIEKAGMYDERYINALDHCEHTYRMSVLGFYTPFNAFADIINSTDYLEDTGIATTLAQDEYRKACIYNGANLFAKTYGVKMIQLAPPSKYQIFSFLATKRFGLAQ